MFHLYYTRIGKILQGSIVLMKFAKKVTLTVLVPSNSEPIRYRTTFVEKTRPAEKPGYLKSDTAPPWAVLNTQFLDLVWMGSCEVCRHCNTISTLFEHKSGRRVVRQIGPLGKEGFLDLVV